jgi:hypothetical protein
MRGAILLYGITRGNGEQVHASLCNTIYKILKAAEHEITVYQHTWEVDRILNPRSKVGEHECEVKNVKDWIVFNADYRSIQDQSKFDDLTDWNQVLKECNIRFDCGHSIHNLKNMYRQMLSLEKVYNMTADATPYDYYMILRQDLLYTHTKDDGILNSINNMQGITKPVIDTPAWGKGSGVNDRISICNRPGANIYCNRWMHVKQSTRQSSEKFLGDILKRNDVIAGKFKQVGRRLRANGQIEQFDRGIFPL